MNNAIVVKGLFLIAFGIILGAFGAHYLESILKPKQLISFKTGVDYQIYGGIVLLILGLNFNTFNFSLKLPTLLFFTGVCLFSSSIYVVSIFHNSFIVSYLWPLTPIGGLLMIIALLIVVYTICKPRE